MHTFKERTGEAIGNVPLRLHADDTFNELKQWIDSRIAGSMQSRSCFDKLPFVSSAGPPKFKLSHGVIVTVPIYA